MQFFLINKSKTSIKIAFTTQKLRHEILKPKKKWQLNCTNSEVVIKDTIFLINKSITSIKNADTVIK